MKRNTMRRLKSIIDLIALVISILALSPPLSSSALAEGGSLSFSVTCSIPVIAGVNAPMIEKEEVRQDTQGIQQADRNAPSVSGEPRPMILQEDRNKEIPLMQGMNMPVTVKTLYSR